MISKLNNNYVSLKRMANGKHREETDIEQVSAVDVKLNRLGIVSFCLPSQRTLFKQTNKTIRAMLLQTWGKGH